MKKFNINSKLIEYLNSEGIYSFNEVQNRVIPLLNKKKNVLVESPTNSGKTFAFLIPAINNLNMHLERNQIVIFEPTNELCIQLNHILTDMAKFVNFTKSNLVYSKVANNNNFLSSQIIITTPTKFISLYKDKSSYLSEIKYVIVDEVDMIINFSDLEIISNLYNKNYFSNDDLSISAFSATFSQNTKDVFLKKMNVKKKFEDVDINIENSVIINLITVIKSKINTFEKLINHVSFNAYFCVVFCGSIIESDSVYNSLRKSGIKDIYKLNSNSTERERLRIYKKINSDKVRYLVTTDLFSRGLDFKNISNIINFSLPKDTNYYKHRIGRINRGDIKGDIYDIYDLNDEKKYYSIRKQNKEITFVNKKI